jgi:hypothetical protein
MEENPKSQAPNPREIQIIKTQEKYRTFWDLDIGTSMGFLVFGVWGLEFFVTS